MEERDKGRLIANLKSLPHELDDLLDGYSDDELRDHPIPGKWSLGELLVHLRDLEREPFQTRLRRTVEESNPVFEPWDDHVEAAAREYSAQDGRHALEEFKGYRAATVAFLESLPVESWGRVGIHPRRGAETIEQQVVHHIKNRDLAHLVQMKDIVRLRMPW
jgi:hypothetical protein